MEEKQESKREIGSKINLKVIIIIIALTISYHAYSSMVEDTEALELTDISYSIGTIACGILSIIISRKYKGSAIFSKAYLAFGVGFLFLGLGDITYNYLSIVLDEVPYPSIADLFFFLFFPFLVYHLAVNIKYFKKKVEISIVIAQISFPAAIAFVYAFLSFDEVSGFDLEFYTSLIYVITSSAILSLSLFGLAIFRKSILGVAWLLLTLGLAIFMIADVWYYYTELLDVWDSTHPTNTMWVLGFTIIFYALYKHKQII